MSKTIQRRARRGRAAWKDDSVWTDKEAGPALARLRDINPQFEFRFAQPKTRERFSDVEEVRGG